MVSTTFRPLTPPAVPRLSTWRRVSVTTTLAVLLTTTAVGAAGAAAPGDTPAPAACSSSIAPELAARLSADIADAQSGHRGRIAFTIRDTEHQLSCAGNADTHFDTASIVKVTILGAVLRRAEEEHRYLADAEADDLRLMITKSDNDAATRLWDSLGLDRLQAFLRLAGMSDTVLATDRRWGLTRTTAADQMKLLDVYTSDLGVITPAARTYGLKLMSQVQADQRWGTPYGAPADVRVQVKNGWAALGGGGWRVHSLGVFTSADHHYRMAVLTDGNAGKADGVDTIQRIAEVVHRHLTSATTAHPALAPSTPAATGVEREMGLAAVAQARSAIGTPYSWGGGTVQGPSLGACDGVNGYLDGVCQADHTVGFDCSGLTLYAWYQASHASIVLPHRSPRQRDHGRSLGKGELIPGDLLFFAEPGGPIHHVGMYIGDGAMIHAEHTGTLVDVLDNVFGDPKWGPRYVGATRPAP